MSVIAKATFALVVEGAMRPVAPDEIHATDVHHDGDPARSLRAASDLVPYRAQADVVLTGHAPVPDESVTVRLAIYRDRALIDKSFDVVPSGDLEGSHRVPLVYEQTPGGPEWDDNPVGTSLPSIVDSSDPQRPVGFGPIAAAWPARARRLGASNPRTLSARIPVLPDEIDWRYYSAAPADQVMEHLQGDEWIVLENLVDDCPTARMQLPNAHAEARIFGLGPAPIVKMLADNLHLDLDRGVGSVTWRGSFEIAHEETMRGVSVMVGVAIAGQPIVWPAVAPPPREAVVVPPPPRASEVDPSFDSTTIMSSDEAERAIAAAEVLPFAPPPPIRPIIPTGSGREPSYSLDETSPLDDEPEETTVPMAQALRRARPAARPSQGIPGAPWSGIPATPVERPDARLDESTRAIRRDGRLARLGLGPQIEKASPVVAPPPPAPIVPAAPPPPPPALKNTPYDRFTTNKK